MTDRELLKVVLEALDLGYDAARAEANEYHAAMAGYDPHRHAQMDAEVQQIADAITAVRAALAEPEQQWQSTADMVQLEKVPAKGGLLPIDALKAELAEPVQEPVAWVDPMWLDPATRGWASISIGSHPFDGWIPLYTAPQQRKPLTEEEIQAVIEAGEYNTIEEFARAIKQAHGIGSKS